MSHSHSSGAGHWPFPEFYIHPVSGGHPTVVAPRLHRTETPMPSVDSEPQEIECTDMLDLAVCIPTGDE
jgi:hypothetical protein